MCFINNNHDCILFARMQRGKNVPHPTLWQINLKLQLSPGLVASYDIWPRHGKHTHLLTYLVAPGPHGTSAVTGITVLETNTEGSGSVRSQTYSYTDVRIRVMLFEQRVFLLKFLYS